MKGLNSARTDISDVVYLRLFSSEVSCVSLSTNNELGSSAWSKDTFFSIYQVCGQLEVGVLEVAECRNSPSLRFAREGRTQLQRMKFFFGDVPFPVVGYVSCPVINAGGADYMTFQYDIRADLMRWQLDAERRAEACFLNARDVVLFLKDFSEHQVVSGYPVHLRNGKVVSMHQKLYFETSASGCKTAIGFYRPSEERSKNMATFVQYAPRQALEEITCKDNETVLSHLILKQAWKKGRVLPLSVACNLLKGLALACMSGEYFRTLFLSYMARQKGTATADDTNRIALFERRLLNGNGVEEEKEVLGNQEDVEVSESDEETGAGAGARKDAGGDAAGTVVDKGVNAVLMVSVVVSTETVMPSFVAIVLYFLCPLAWVYMPV